MRPAPPSCIPMAVGAWKPESWPQPLSAGPAASGYVLHTLSRPYMQNRGCCQISSHKPWEKALFYIFGKHSPGWVHTHHTHTVLQRSDEYLPPWITGISGDLWPYPTSPQQFSVVAWAGWGRVYIHKGCRRHHAARLPWILASAS